MNSPLISVVIPAYNAAKTLESTVDSVFGQTVQDFEVIIVNDGSKDGTLAVADSIAVRDSRVRVLSQANGGASATRNTGIAAATGKYVAFLDADDLWMPHKLERQIAVLNAQKDATAVQCGVYYVDNDLEVLSVRPCFQSKDVLLETLLFQNLPGLMSALMVERNALENIGYLDTKLEILEDWELAIRLSRYCNLQSIEEPLALYRQYPGNRSKNLSIHIKPGYIVLDRLFNDPSLPARIKEKRALIYSTFYRMLCGGAFNIGKYTESLKWGVKALITHPAAAGYIVALPFRRLQRKASRQMVTDDYKAAATKFLRTKSDTVIRSKAFYEN